MLIFYPCETSQISKTSKTFDTFSYFLTGQYFFTVGGLWSAYERKIELEIALEQDEHPLHDEVELETEEEEAASVSEKRLKREIRAEAVRRLEEAARTEADFSVVIKEWDKLDQNRERRERNYEHLRGDLPLDYQAVSEPKLDRKSVV